MPTYEYACTSCTHHVEVVQSFTDKPLESCERCGGRLRRVFHPAGILFKGSGFYSTDNRSSKPAAKKEKETAKTESSPASPASSPSEKSA